MSYLLYGLFIAVGAGVLYLVGGVLALLIKSAIEAFCSRFERRRLHFETEQAIQEMNIRAFLAEYEMIREVRKVMDQDWNKRNSH